MKIAQIACAYPPYKSGLGNAAFFFANVCRDSGWESYVFTPAYEGGGGWQNENGVFVYRLKPILKYGKGAFLPSLFLCLNQIDIIHLHYPFFGGSEIVWLRRLFSGRNKKLAIHYHMDVPANNLLFKFLSWPSKLIKNKLFKTADAITCASFDYLQASSLSFFYKNFRHKFYELPFGVDDQLFSPGLTDKNKIVFIGTLDKAHNFKGLEILLQAFSQNDFKEKKLIIIGGGEKLAYYQKIAKELNIADRVDFTGEIEENKKAEILKGAAVLVLPSINKNEAFGLVLLEAMSCGIPVVASDLPGVRKVFIDGQHGFLAKPGDADDFKKKIKIILDNEAKRLSMGLAARQFVLVKYGKARASNNIYKFYLKLAKNQI